MVGLNYGWCSLAVLLTFGLVYAVDDGPPRVVCYHVNWSSYHVGRGKFLVTDIDPWLCSHLVYAFAGFNSTGHLTVLDDFADLPDNGGEDGYNDFAKLKVTNPRLKTLLGVTAENLVFSEVMADPRLREVFVDSLVAFIRRFRLDGASLEWVYPLPSDRASLVDLLRELRPVFDREGLLLCAGVTGVRSIAMQAYDVPALDRYLDWMNVMAMDFHGAWENVAGQNAPLHPSSVDVTPGSRELNADASVRFLLSQGATPSKVVLGVAGYGGSFTLASPSAAGLGAATLGPGDAGPYTEEPGFLSYLEVCEYLKSGDWHVSWDNDQKMPFASKGNQWIGYDDVTSVAAKASYVRGLRLGGAALWNIGLDDFRGLCGEGRFPLLTAINRNLGLNLRNAVKPNGGRRRNVVVRKLGSSLEQLFSK